MLKSKIAFLVENTYVGRSVWVSPDLCFSVQGFQQPSWGWRLPRIISRLYKPFIYLKHWFLEKMAGLKGELQSIIFYQGPIMPKPQFPGLYHQISQDFKTQNWQPCFIVQLRICSFQTAHICIRDFTGCGLHSRSSHSKLLRNPQQQINVCATAVGLQNKKHTAGKAMLFFVWTGW